MKVIRRKFLCLFGITAAVPAISRFALAQSQAGPSQPEQDDYDCQRVLNHARLPVAMEHF